MVDPLTILAGIKTGLAAGKTVAGLSKQIGQFFDATDHDKKTLQKRCIKPKHQCYGVGSLGETSTGCRS